MTQLNLFQNVSEPFTKEENRAVSLYVIAARDVGDLLDLLPGENEAVLKILYQMLSTPNESNTKSDKELNALLAPIVKSAIDARFPGVSG